MRKMLFIRVHDSKKELNPSFTEAGIPYHAFIVFNIHGGNLEGLYNLIRHERPRFIIFPDVPTQALEPFYDKAMRAIGDFDIDTELYLLGRNHKELPGVVHIEFAAISTTLVPKLKEHH